MSLRIPRHEAGPGFLIVSGVSLLHLMQGALLIYAGGAADGVSSMASLIAVLGPPVSVGIILIAASLFAISGVLVPSVSTTLRLAAVLPQQIILMIVAFGSIRYSVESRFADGVLRPWTFILDDQLPPIVLMLMHTASLWRWRQHHAAT